MNLIKEIQKQILNSTNIETRNELSKHIEEAFATSTKPGARFNFSGAPTNPTVNQPTQFKQQQGAQQQQASQQKVEFSDLKSAWEQAGSPKMPEKVYQLLNRIIKNHQIVNDAFKEIGISFEKTDKGPAEVLDKNLVVSLERYAKTLSPERLRDLIIKINQS